jgi:amino acid transporter
MGRVYSVIEQTFQSPRPYSAAMAIMEPPAQATGEKGLQAGALGLAGNIVIGLASVAPAYSLAATLGYVVLAVGDKSPSMFVLAFIPMLLVAFAYRELSRDTPDCGTAFTWATKAFGPWIGWIGGWGLAVSAIIVLANVAEIAAIYLFRSSAWTRSPRRCGPRCCSGRFSSSP